MRHLVFMLCAILMTIGCSEYDLAGEDGDDDSEPADDDTSELSDDDTTAVDDDDDSATPPNPCVDQVWPDLEVEVDDSCCGESVAAVWDMHVTGTFEGQTNCGPLHVGRMLDVTGDGAVDVADPMQIWSHETMYAGAELISHDGLLIHSILNDTRTISASIGDVIPSLPGMELVAVHDPEWDDNFDKVGIWDADGNGPPWLVDIPLYSERRPWLTDLEGDGTVEVLSGAFIFDGLTGAQLATLDGMPPDDTGAPVAADLDLDGVQEIIATSEYGFQDMGLFAPDGTRLQTCRQDIANWNYTIYAIGDLDGDPGGEIVAAWAHNIAVYDSDCTVLAQVNLGVSQPAVIGLGELDADPFPEIVVGDQPNGIFVLDHDLTLKWQWQHADNTVSHYPFALADLDADGLHEVLIRTFPELVILEEDGSVATTFPPPSCSCSSWIGAPVVVDIDADGLAEIVMPAWPTVAVLENDYGGWWLEGSDEPWTWIEKFPGSRTPTGDVPTPTTTPWQDPATNVWQALPANPDALLPQPDLFVQDIDVCTAEGYDDAWVTAYIANQGGLLAADDVIVFLYTQPDATYIADEVIPSHLASGVSRAVQFVVPISETLGGLEVVADVLEDIPECDEDNNSATWP